MLGGFAPLPIRLGGPRNTGVTAAQHARLCADLAAVVRVVPFAVFRFSQDALDTVTVRAYYGRNGNGVNYAPTPNPQGGVDMEVQWDFEGIYSDPYDRSSSIAVRHVVVTSNTAGVAAAIASVPVTNRVVTTQSGAGDVTVAVWA
jgi:hypothetical protein